MLRETFRVCMHRRDDELMKGQVMQNSSAFLPRRRHRGRIVPAIALLAVALSACSTNITESYTGGPADSDTPAIDAKSARVVLMPIDIKLTELTAAGLEEPKAAWTELARGHVTNGIHAYLGEKGLKPRDYAKPAEAKARRRDDQLAKLHAQVGGTILRHHYDTQNRLPTKQGRMDWTLGATARQLGNGQQAEFALFVFMRDSYATGGRKAAVAVSRVLGAGVQAGERVGFASLVDLRSGKVVWFNALYSDSGDLREAEPAKEVVGDLMGGFPI